MEFLVVTGKLDAATIHTLRDWLNATRKSGQPVLNLLGPDKLDAADVRQLQWKINVRADSTFGPKSARALEAYVGVPAETIPGWYPGLIRGLQRKLNAEIQKGTIR